MLRSGALATHRVLVILHGAVMEKEDAKRIARWIKTGQRAIVMGVPKFESVEGGREPETTLFGDTPSGRSLGKGQIVRVTTEADLAVHLGKDMRDLGLAVYDLRKNGVFGTQIDVNKFLFLNTGAAAAKVKVECKGNAVERQINGGTISEVEVK
jgi:hypothetical protein